MSEKVTVVWLAGSAVTAFIGFISQGDAFGNGRQFCAWLLFWPVVVIAKGIAGLCEMARGE